MARRTENPQDNYQYKQPQQGYQMPPAGYGEYQEQPKQQPQESAEYTGKVYDNKEYIVEGLTHTYAFPKGMRRVIDGRRAIALEERGIAKIIGEAK